MGKSQEVLILTPFYPPNIGGAETFAEGLAREMGKWFTTIVLTFMPFRGTENNLPSKRYENGSLVYRLKWLFVPPKAWKGTSLKNMFLVLPKMVLFLFFLCHRRRFRIVHSLGFISGLAGVLLKSIFHYKHYITILAIYDFKNKSRMFKKVAKWILKHSDLVFVEGENGKKDIDGLVDIRKVRKFNHWVDQKVFYPPSVRIPKPVRVLFVGRPIPEKGKQILKDAEHIINHPKKYIFTYVENVAYEDLPNFYRRNHVVCVPSAYHEGFSRVVAEAASCGCAIITSDRGSLPEMVRDFGISVSLEKFADRLRMFLEEDLSEWGKKSYDYAKRNFTNSNAWVFLREY